MTERELFEAALEREPSDRAAFLDQACAGAPSVRKRLDALLARQEQAGSFLELPVADKISTAEECLSAAGTEGEPNDVLAGRYKLLEPIGEGGMGAVWLALQSEPVRRKVAVKLVKAGMDSRMVLSRFEAERQALALMDHPNIAKVLDGGTTERGRPFFVMEYVKGVAITQYCDDAGLTIAERLRLFIPVCQAVQHAHQKGVIHRDLKPSNLLICLYDDRPVPKVIDFGLAKAMHEPLTARTLYTAHGLMLGTPLYMSPEQVAVNNLDVDTRTDIYSLGVVLYELLTGTTPLAKDQLQRSSWPEVLRLIKETEPPKPSTRLPKDQVKAGAKVHSSFIRHPSSFKELDWIVMKALDKDRRRRYETANGLARDLEHYLNDEPVEAGPPSTWYRLRKLARRNRALLATAAVVCLALVLGTAVSIWQAFLATEANRATARQLQRAKNAEEQANRDLFDSLLAQARANRLSRRIGLRFGTLDILRRAIVLARQLQLLNERSLALRNEALAALALTDLRVSQEWPDSPGPDVCFDYQFKHYCRADLNGTAYVRRVGAGTETCRLSGPGAGENGLQFSPDGNLLAVVHRRLGRVQIWRLSGSATANGRESPVKVFDEPWHAWNFCISPDSRLAAFQQTDSSVVVFEIATGNRVGRLAANGDIQGLTFSPDGRQLALVTEGVAQVRDWQTDAVRWEKPVSGDGYWLAWNPDGKTLAIGETLTNADIISLWDVAADKQTGKLEGMQGSGVRCTFNHAGTLLASTGWAGILRLWDPLTGRLLFTTFDSGMITPRFSPDDSFLAGTQHENNLRIWEIAVGNEYRTLIPDRAAGDRPLHCSAVSADGRLVAAGALGGFGIWDLPSHSNLAFVDDGEGLRFVLFGPGGSLLSMGENGLFRRTLHRDAATGSLRLGPPEKLPIPGVPNAIAQNADGKVIAAANFSGAYVWHADQPERFISLGPHEDARCIAVSPNGLWVATGGFGYPGGAKAWDARVGGKPAQDFPIGPNCWPVFSPDGKRLVVASGTSAAARIRMWNVEGWEEVPFPETVQGAFPAFSPDGKLLVVETGASVARLLDPKTGRELARLEDPSQDRANHFCFSPDSTKLISATADGHCLHVWDLKLLHRGLAELGLDWDSP